MKNRVTQICLTPPHHKYYYLTQSFRILFTINHFSFLGELYSSAAELATEAMKGKLASKYFMQAEEAWAECEE